MEKSVKLAWIIGLITANLDDRQLEYVSEKVSQEAMDAVTKATVKMLMHVANGEDYRTELLDHIVEMIEEIKE